MKTDYDLFVIGAGSGGVRAARRAAERGAKAAIAESGRLGGTCVNVGCVPKKLMVFASEFAGAFADAPGFGWSVGETRFDWASLISAKDREITRLNEIYAGLLDKAGVTTHLGRATLVDANTVTINGQRYTAKHILLATGSKPTRPDINGAELGIVSDDVFALAKLPRRILIVGGGYIGVEFAGIFAGLGSEVTLTYRGSLFLRGFDDELRTELADHMTARGITLRFQHNVESIERADDGESLTVTLTDEQRVEVDAVLFATGRAPNTRGLGLEHAGVEVGRLGEVMVDVYSRSSVESIYAIGDCTDRMNLTPVAIAEGEAFVRTVFDGEPTPMHYRDIPTAVFSQPPLACVGFTEPAARAEFSDVHVYRSHFRPLQQTLSGRTERTLMKLIVDAASDRVVGAHMLGPHAGEIMQGVAIAVRAGLSKADFDATVAVHPTIAEEFVTMRVKAPYNAG